MKNRSAFTLLELSIVLVVIGLISGGIIVGQSLIRQAQLRAAVSEYDTYLKAIKEFQDKYLALPGDMNNATSIWTTAATANGDGSGTIGSSDTSGDFFSPSGTGGINGIGPSTEWFLAWQHLALAGFIPGKYPGTNGLGIAALATVGVNIPASKLSGAGWMLMYYLNTTSDRELWRDQYGHILIFGANSSVLFGMNDTNGLITPAEASEFAVVGDTRNIGYVIGSSEAADIDAKFDDGMPGTGKIRAWRTSVLPHCTVSDTSQTNQAYNPSQTVNSACSLVFLLGF